MVRAYLDQHFLVDAHAADRIVDASAPKGGEAYLEIGPGRGILTERLLARGVRLTAIEIDDALHAGLAARFPGLDARLADFLTLDLSTLPSPVKVVSNLPYSVGTPILQRLLPWEGWTEAILMFQKEVAERISAGPGSRDYGLLSLSVAVYAESAPVMTVGRFSFRPPPKVESAVVRLLRRGRPRLPEGLAPEAFFRVAKAAFSQRRKMAANAIASALGIERSRAAAALEKAGVSATARGEEIGLDAYAALALALR